MILGKSEKSIKKIKRLKSIVCKRPMLLGGET